MFIGIIIYFYVIKSQYTIRIVAFKLIGNTPTRVANYCAKDVPFGFAGDKLWRVAPVSLLSRPFKIVKWLSIGKFQTASNEFWYWIREDGEWINFSLTDIDTQSRQMKVKFVQEDMRLQRLATEKLLQTRLLDKTFWEKWGMVIGYVIFFMFITIALIIIFYQWSKLLDKTAPLIDTMKIALEKLQEHCTPVNSLIPVD